MLRLGAPSRQGSNVALQFLNRGFAQSIRYAPPDLHPRCWLSVLHYTRESNRVSEPEARAGQTSLGGMPSRCGLRRDGFAASSESNPGGAF